MRNEMIASATDISPARGIVVPVHGTGSSVVELFEPVGYPAVEAAEFCFASSCGLLAGGAADDGSG
jgi:hypothetical protein